MTLLTRMLCRWWGCLAPGRERRERAADKAEAGEPPEVSPGDRFGQFCKRTPGGIARRQRRISNAAQKVRLLDYTRG